jgi:ABC-type nitrate/sulfonate/bicarbonate transport system substrate-binding protein
MANGKIRIATSHYHVGHAIAPMAALEKGFFKEEGFDGFELLLEGLIPAFVEREALSVAMKERGIDIVLGARITSVLALNSRGEDLYILSGWRFAPQVDVYARPGIKSFADLKGKKIGIRDAGGISQGILQNELRKAGLDPETDVSWVRDRIFAYHNTPEHVQALSDGRVDCVGSHPPFSDELERMGCTVLLSPRALYPGGRPERVVAARRSLIEERGEELRGFLRGILRAFWLMRDQPESFSYLADLERRLRLTSHDPDERVLRMFTSPDRLESMPLPVDGEAPVAGLKRIAEEMKRDSQIPNDFSAERALKDEAAKKAFQDLRSRKELEAQWTRVTRVVEKHGY